MSEHFRGAEFVRQISPSIDSRKRARSEEDISELLFAVPKKGRLNDEVMKLLNGAGLKFKRPDRLDVALCKDLPVRLVFLPAADIPMYIMDGNVDIGISGLDVLEETLQNAGLSLGNGKPQAPVKVVMELGFGKCKLCLQAPKEYCSLGPKAFKGKRIVTSFPALTKKYFEELSPETGEATQIKVVSGSVEAACGLGLADAIVDLVETGTTMKAAGLDVVSEVFSTQAIIMQQLPTPDNNLQSGTKADLLALILKRIAGYMTATRNLYLVYNCKEADLKACCKITPGKRSPTITKLQEEGWYAVSVVTDKEGVHKLMDRLTDAGAIDILCTALDNTRI